MKNKIINLLLVLAMMTGTLYIYSCKDDNGDIIEAIEKSDKELKEQIAALSKTMGDITNALQGLTEKVGGLATKEDVEAVKGVVDELATKLAEVSTTVGTLKDDISADVKTQLETQLDAIQTAIGELKTALETKIEGSDSKTQTQYEGLLGKLEGLETQLIQLQTYVKAVQTDVEETKKDVQLKQTSYTIDDEAFATYLRGEIPSAFTYPDKPIIRANAKVLELTEFTFDEKAQKDIKSLKAIEIFTGLKKLDISGFEKLDTLDVSKNKELTTLNVSNTRLKSLNLNDEIEVINASNNDELNALAAAITGKNKLTTLDVSSTKIKSLDVSSNTALATLNVNNCNGLTNLNASNTKITSLDASSNSALATLDVSSTNITSLDVSSNTALATLNVSNTNITSLNVSSNTALAELNVETCKALTTLDISNTQLDQQNFKYSQNPQLNSLTANNTKIAAFDLSTLSNLKTFVAEHSNNDNNNITSLTIGIAGLETLNVKGNAIKNLDFATATELETVDISGNKFENILDLSNNKNLKTLDVSENADLENLTFANDNNTTLTELNIQKTKIATEKNFELDLSKITAFTQLSHVGLTTNESLPAGDPEKSKTQSYIRW